MQEDGQIQVHMQNKSRKHCMAATCRSSPALRSSAFRCGDLVLSSSSNQALCSALHRVLESSSFNTKRKMAGIKDPRVPFTLYLQSFVVLICPSHFICHGADPLCASSFHLSLLFLSCLLTDILSIPTQNITIVFNKMNDLIR